MYFFICLVTIFASCNAKVKTFCELHDKMIDYHGSITTLRDRIYPVSYIAIADKQKHIPAYRAPCNTDQIIPHLSYNPKKCEMVCLNLADIKELQMPYPYATWIYKHEGHKGKDKYLLIQITWQDEKKPKTYYLIEPKRRLTSTITKRGREIPHSIPFSGFKNLTITRRKK